MNRRAGGSSSRLGFATEAGDRRGESLRRHRLEEVVQGVDVEGAEGVGVVGRDEDHPGPDGGALEEVEPGLARHLHVEEDHVGLLALDEAGRLVHVRGLAHDLDLGVRGEEPPQLLAGQPLVVHDQGPDRLLHAGAPSPTSSIRARTQPSSCPTWN